MARCETRARDMGYGAFRVANLFALRATDPRDLRPAADPNGPQNDLILSEAADWADTLLCAWGNHGGLRGRAAEVEPLLRTSGKPLLHLGLTSAGHPRHPLYTARARRAEPWELTPPAR